MIYYVTTRLVLRELNFTSQSSNTKISYFHVPVIYDDWFDINLSCPRSLSSHSLSFGLLFSKHNMFSLFCDLQNEASTAYINLYRGLKYLLNIIYFIRILIHTFWYINMLDVTASYGTPFDYVVFFWVF